MTQGQRLAEAVLTQLVGVVEARTRFDRTSLRTTGCVTETMNLVANEQNRVGFTQEEKEGPGPLPVLATNVSSALLLASHVAALKSSASVAFPERLKGWLQQQTTLPGRPLAPRDCFGGPQYAGFQYQCTNCSGSGKAACSSCGGRGTRTCSGCGGSGKGQKGTCTACGGMGFWACTNCGRTGKVPCTGCGTTGQRHRLVKLECTVDNTFEATATTDLAEVTARVKSIGSLQSLCALAEVQQEAAQVGSDNVGRSFRAQMLVTTLTVSAEGRTFDVLGYGEQAQVSDFKDIVGALASNDLGLLTAALRTQPALALHRSPQLVSALTTILSSEINAAIATIKFKKKQLARVVQEEHKGAVSEQYFADARAAIQTAIARVYRPGALRGLGAAVVTPMFVVIAFLMLPKAAQEPVFKYMFPILLLVCVICPFIMERLAFWRFRASFEVALVPRAVELLTVARSRWWWFFGMVASSVVFTTGFVFLLVLLAAKGVLRFNT